VGRLRKQGDVYFAACFSPHLYRARNLVELVERDQGIKAKQHVRCCRVSGRRVDIAKSTRLTLSGHPVVNYCTTDVGFLCPLPSRPEAARTLRARRVP
jgi:hypothetical protein